MKPILLFGVALFVAAPLAGQQLVPARRADSMAVSTRTIAQSLMQQHAPSLAFDAGFTPREFTRWQHRVRSEMARLMAHPSHKGLSEPRMIASEPREGYTLQRWECYPFAGCAVPYLVLIPDHLTAPAPAVLCIPGSGQTKELLAGEPELCPAFVLPAAEARNDMARQFVRQGLVAVAVDNPSTGEASDLEGYAPAYRGYDYDDASRMLLEMGWSYQGYTSYVDRCVLEWIKRQPFVRADRIVVSGFSLGTETLMILGVLDESIYAFVYNDFLCRTRERALAMSAPGKDGRRHFPNSIRHLIPGKLTRFDFPDLVAALAPRPVICTEGGMDRDFELVRRAYALAGKSGNCLCLHQPRYADPAARQQVTHIPAGVGRDEFFRMANVDPANHYFKGEVILPWLWGVMNGAQ